MIGADGNSVVKGRSAMGFSNTEAKAAGLTEVVPFFVEDVVRQNGGHYAKADD